MSVRLGLLGAGGIGSTYLDHLDDIAVADVVAVCDLDRSRAETAADPRDATVHTDVDAILDRDLDALVVATPPFARGDPEVAAAERGIDLFVAKPVARDREVAGEVLAAIEEGGVTAGVGYMWRYADAVDRARELLDGRRLGLADGQVWVDVPPAPWWGEREKSGGQVVEQATHVYDLLRYLAGDVTRVAATGGRPLGVEGIDFEDVTSASLRHAGGAVGHVSTTCGAPDHRYDLHLVAGDARLHLHCLENELTGTVDGEPVRYEGEADGYRRQLAAFVEAVEADDPSLVRSPYADAVRTLDLTLAVTEAVGAGETVTLDR